MKLNDIHIVYFIGIGGIGMSALARWFRHLGREVYGYDRTRTPLTNQLEEEGIPIHYKDEVELIPANVTQEIAETLVVFTPAIPIDHREFNFLRDKGFKILKRSEVLGMITAGLQTVAVAGTHGKTTTSSMIAHVLHHANIPAVGFLGGILQGYESNLILSGNQPERSIAVVEADEFDRSFLKLYPDLAVVTSMDADHLDIYGDYESLRSSFSEFIQQVRSKGFLVVNERLSEVLEMQDIDNKVSYGIDRGLCCASNIRIVEGCFTFDFSGMGVHINDIRLGMPGYHNVENAVAAIAACLHLNVNAAVIKDGLEGYRGVKRRFEYRVKEEHVIYIDDYAHHPAEIDALAASVRALYNDRKVTAVFQPHLYSRTRDFATEFAQSLDRFDEVILLEIYPAREIPIEGVSSRIIYDGMRMSNKRMCKDEDLVNQLREMELEVLLTIGAGNIDRLVEPIEKMLKD